MQDSCPHPLPDAEAFSSKLLRVPDSDLLAAMRAAEMGVADLADPFDEDDELAPSVSWVA